MADVKNKRVNIYIDSAAAENALKSLQVKADGFNKQIDKTRKSQEALLEKIAKTGASGKDVSQLQSKYDDLGKSIKDVQVKAQENLDAQKKLTDQISKGMGPTLRQQTQLVSLLNNQLKLLPIGTDEFKKKLLDLRQAEGVLNGIRTKIKDVDDAQKEIVKSSGLITQAGVGIATFFANLAANFLQNIVGTIVNTGKEMIQLSLQAEGVEYAFNRLNKPGLLDQLRKATQGTVSDLELMKRAVQANNFQIPLETLSTLLEFAQRRARETGESVDYLVESIVTGIARKSPLILDNLGINIQRIQKEFEKTGDFAKAAMTVVNEELTKAGAAVQLNADKVDRWSAKWQNIKKVSGDALVYFANTVSDGMDRMGAIINHNLAQLQATGSLLKSLATFDMKGIEQSFDRLRNNSPEKTDKQKRLLQEEINLISKDVLRYQGNTIDERKKYLIDLQKEVSYGEQKLQQARKENNKRLVEDLEKSTTGYKNAINTLKAIIAAPPEVKKTVNKGETLSGIESEANLLQEALKSLKIGSEEFKKTQDRIKELNKLTDDATGKTAEENEKKRKDAAKKSADEFKKQLQERKKLLEDYNKFAEQLNRDINDLLTPEGSKKWVAVFRETEDELEKINALALGHEQKQELVTKALEKQRLKLKDLAEEAAKIVNPPVNNSTVTDAPNGFALPKALEEKVQVKLLPVIEDEDAAIAGKALLTVIDRIREETDKRFETTLEKINFVLDIASQVTGVLDNINNTIANREDAKLKKELQGNDARKKSIKDLENSKVISAQEAKRRMNALEAEEDKKREALSKKQFERSKKLQIAQALINGAMGVTAVLAAKPGIADIISLAAFRAINIGLTIATTLAQVAAISSQKYAKGGKMTGPSHSEGGMPVINPRTGRKEAEVEGGEYILSKATVANNREIADALLDASLNRGGMRVRQSWETRPYKPMNYTALAQTMQKVKWATGGVWPSESKEMARPQQVAPPATDPLLIDTLLQMRYVISTLDARIANGIEANVSLHKLKKAEAQQGRIDDDASFR